MQRMLEALSSSIAQEVGQHGRGWGDDEKTWVQQTTNCKTVKFAAFGTLRVAMPYLSSHIFLWEEANTQNINLSDREAARASAENQMNKKKHNCNNLKYSKPECSTTYNSPLLTA